jgi:hypothetical protein
MPTQQVIRPDAAAEQSRTVPRIGADLWVGTAILTILVVARFVLHVL